MVQTSGFYCCPSLVSVGLRVDSCRDTIVGGRGGEGVTW